MQPILKIDLTEKIIDQLYIPEEWARDYIGAASLAPRLLFDSLKPECQLPPDHLGPLGI